LAILGLVICTEISGGLGFKDFVLFNQAMLGKQCWRLITEPNSLCARVLKGRYFPDCDFLKAHKPRLSSFTWRSILFGRDLVMKGLQWGVGNGASINIPKDNWIPGHPTGTFTTLEPMAEEAKVQNLLTEEGLWDMKIINLFFQKCSCQ
jgi:hypothetical protein